MTTISQYPLSIKGAYRLYALRVIRGLYHVPRTGYKDRGVKRPESVGQHVQELLEMADFFFPNCRGLKAMLKIHDWPEYKKKVGDRRTDKYCPEDHRYTLEEKRIAELAAMEEICARLGPYGKAKLKLWLEYEAGKTLRAKRAYQLDKLQTDLKSAKYQMAGQPISAAQFIELNKNKIIIPELRMILEEMELKLQKYLTSKKIKQ
jgi:5'-deoxynucleotidase YfbR-like HD superfamily hydrolase